MARKSSSNKIGGWAFLVGVILAVIFGVMGNIGTTMLWVLVLIGLIVGFMNVAEDESSHFLMSGAVLIIASAFGGGVMSNLPIAVSILDSLLLIFVPAVIVVAVRNVFTIARH